MNFRGVHHLFSGRILWVIVALILSVTLSGCLLDITSIDLPATTSTGKVITFTVNGAVVNNGDTRPAGIVLQIPEGTQVLRAHYSGGDLTTDNTITAGYAAEAGYQLYGGTASGGSAGDVTLKVWLAIPGDVNPGEYAVKAAVGVFAGGIWTPQNPQNAGIPILDFSQISGQYASSPIVISAGAPDATPPANVTPAIAPYYNAISLDISAYNEEAQGDVAEYRVHVSKNPFSDVTGRQLLDETTTPSVTADNNSNVSFSGDIASGLFYFPLPPGAEYPTVISGLMSNTYYFAVTAVDLSGNESHRLVVPLLRGSVSGTVTNGVNGIQGVSVYVYDTNYNFMSQFQTDSNGQYVGGLPSGSYKVYFYGDNAGYISEWYSDKADFDSADSVAVTVGNTTSGIDAVLSVGGSIAGTVTDGINGIQGVAVSMCAPMNEGYICNSGSYTDSNGQYSVGGLPSGSYKVYFYGNNTGYISEWYDDKADFDSADAVAVTAGNTTSGIDAVLSLGGSITGTVTNGVNGIQGVWVYVYDTNYNWMSQFQTDSNGQYVVGGLPSGSYKVYFYGDNAGYLNEWYNDKADFDSANSVAVTVGNTTSGINAVLSLGGSITGTVTDGVNGIQGVELSVCDSNYSQCWGSYTDSNGQYLVGRLPSGSYKVYFYGNNTGYISEWYNDKADFDSANSVAVTVGNTTSGIDAVLSLGGSITGRVTDGTTGIANIQATVYDSNCNYYISYGYADANGYYTVGGIPTGIYKVAFYGGGQGYADEWYNNHPDCSSADTVLVTALNTTSLADAVLVEWNINALVNNYYWSILGRNPDEGGLHYWDSEIQRLVSLGIDTKEGFIALGKQFFKSSEYAGKNKQKWEYVRDLYLTFLQREPDQGGWDFWTGYLTNGASRDLVTNYFVFSDEFKAYIEGVFGVSDARPENNLVNDFYRGLLGRLPDDSGFNYWLGQMRAAQCAGNEQQIRDLSYQLALLFIQSQEYANRGRDNKGYIEDLYDAIMRRSADPVNEVGYWVSMLNTMTRAEVLQLFTTSAEYQNRVTEVINAGCIESK